MVATLASHFVPAVTLVDPEILANIAISRISDHTGPQPRWSFGGPVCDACGADISDHTIGAVYDGEAIGVTSPRAIGEDIEKDFHEHFHESRSCAVHYSS